MTLDIIIPLFNKEKSILNFYNKINDELKDIRHNIIFIDNCSTDKTPEILKEIYQKDDLNVKIISLSKTHDKQATILSGLTYSTSDLVCIFDLDLQSNVSQITKMYDFLKEDDNYDSVCMYSNYQEKNFIKKFKLKIVNKLFELNIDPNRTNNRMMKRNVVNAILKSKLVYSNYIYVLIGFSTYYLKFDNKNKQEKIKVNDYIIYSEKPFKFIKILNILLLLIFAILLTLRLLKIFHVGNSTLFFSILILSIIQLFITRFSSNYINNRNKAKKFYIKDKIGFDDNIL